MDKFIKTASSGKETFQFTHFTGFDVYIFFWFVMHCLGFPLFSKVNTPRIWQGDEEAMQNPIITVTGTYTPLICMSMMAASTEDSDTSTMGTSRQMIHAYFLGRKMGSAHFMDAIMNGIVKYMRKDGPPQPDLVKEAYEQANTVMLHGLKKFLIDYYIWMTKVLTSARYPSIQSYPLAFIADVNTTLADIEEQVIIDPNDSLRRTESKDVVIDFWQLEHYLCTARQGRLKCRYHHHTPYECCFNLIVDNTPIQLP